jgi:hypothetical protein
VNANPIHVDVTGFKARNTAQSPSTSWRSPPSRWRGTLLTAEPLPGLLTIGSLASSKTCTDCRNLLTLFAVTEGECSQIFGDSEEQEDVLEKRTATGVDTEMIFATPLSTHCPEAGGIAIRWRRRPSQLQFLTHTGPLSFRDLVLAKHPVSRFGSATCVGLSIPRIMHMARGKIGGATVQNNIDASSLVDFDRPP